MFYPPDAVEALIERLGLRESEAGTAPPTPALVTCDPRWKRISASLRKDPNDVEGLYIKLPATTLWQVILGIAHARAMSFEDEDLGTLPQLHDFLRQEHAASMAPSIFLWIPAEEVKRDLVYLEAVQGHDRSGFVAAFAKALHSGLRNDPEVDWITRCGGPAYVVSDSDPTPQGGDEEILGLPEQG